MSRSDVPTRARLMLAASKRFSTLGYHGTSMRDLAADVEIRVSGLYNHFASKEQLLYEFLHDATTRLLDSLIASQQSVCKSRECRLMALVMAQVEFDLHNREVTIVNNHEFRHLTPPFRDLLVVDRDRIEAIFSEIACGARPEHRSPEDRLVVNAVTSITKGVSEWYNPTGPWNVRTLAERQALLALRLIGAERPALHDGCSIGMGVLAGCAPLISSGASNVG